MNKVPLKIQYLSNFKGEPLKYQTSGASGFDVCAMLDEPLTLKVGQRALIPTGVSFEIPINFEVQVRPRSGLALKKGVSIPNSPGTIDCDYRGEVKVIIINSGEEGFQINPLDRIAQLVLAPVVQAEFCVVDSLEETRRGVDGFGSTGV